MSTEKSRARSRAYYVANREREIARTKAWHAANPERRKAIQDAWRTRNPTRVRENWMRWKYGMTLAEFDAVLDGQGMACAICRATDMAWCIDHDHKTGVVRGILCRRCNLTLSGFQDDPELFRRAAEYLETKR